MLTLKDSPRGWGQGGSYDTRKFPGSAELRGIRDVWHRRMAGNSRTSAPSNGIQPHMERVLLQIVEKGNGGGVEAGIGCRLLV